MAKSPKTCTSHSPPRARTLSGPATRRLYTRELLQSRNRAFGPNGVPTTSRQTSATRTDTTSRLPISLGSTNKRYEPSTHLRPDMTKHLALSPSEAADRLALRELIHAFAHCAVRTDTKNQMALYTQDTPFVVYMDAKDPKPSQELHSREALAPAFADLNKYAATMHFLGQTTILTLTGDRGTAETYFTPHHLTIEGGKRQLMIAALRYYDTFVKVDGEWLFAERLLYVEWIEGRVLA